MEAATVGGKHLHGSYFAVHCSIQNAHLPLHFFLDYSWQLDELLYYHLSMFRRSPTLNTGSTSKSKRLERSKVKNMGTCKLKIGFS